jgi:hypothetical protein
MDLLHFVFAFNLVTAIFILAGAYYLHYKYDEKIDAKPYEYIGYSGAQAAGIAGAMIGVGLLSGLVTLFV